MRKSIIVLIALFLSVGVAFGQTPGYRLGPGSPGTLASNQGGYQSDPSKTFRLVRYVQQEIADETYNLTADALVIWDTRSADDGVTITTSTTSYDSRVAGIVVQLCLTAEDTSDTAAQAIGKRNWTWLQTYGRSDVDFGVAMTGAVNAAFGISSAQPGTAGMWSNWFLSTDSTGVISGGSAGFIMDAATAGAQGVDCFLRCE